MAKSAVLLLWAQALSLAGTQHSQLTLEPPWIPVFTDEEVELSCQGSSKPNYTMWYLNKKPWKKTRHTNLLVSSPGSYQCHSPGANLSLPITLSFSNAWLVLQVPARELLEGDEVWLRCRYWNDKEVKNIAEVRFFQEGKLLQGPSRQAELLLYPLQLQHRGRYHCQAKAGKFFKSNTKSVPTMVTVQELFSVPVLESPAEIREGSPLVLGCLSHLSPLRPLTHRLYIFYRGEVVVGGPQDSSQLRLPAVDLLHSGSYSCEVRTDTGSVRKRSARLTVTVHRIPVSGVSLEAQPHEGQVVEGERLVLSCSVAAGTGPISFSWHRQGSAAPLATGPRYNVRSVRQRDSGHYQCAATNGGPAATSPALRVTVLVPVTGATITMARTEPSVPAGESLNLSCSVRDGTAPVTFTWLRDGQELGSGPVLALGTVGSAHAGSYQCLATNRLGARRIFRALSRALPLSVTPPEQSQPEPRQRGAAVATGLGVSLPLLLLLLLAGGWQLRRRHRAGAGKSRGRDPAAPPEAEGRRLEPTAPPAEPEEGEVQYAHIVLTERGPSPPRSPRGSPRSAPEPEPQVTYAVVPGPHARPRLSSDTYENIP
ncbi:Fc receptor-like protein 3 [Colius striatus]|uniref:Fc receptor-like protein 3 n=1 Tax=Colius striatus TaxID=57412 RepID=UPI002B1E260E|nr:Fc receptor-like protein 3 [Colius striatus]